MTKKSASMNAVSTQKKRLLAIDTSTSPGFAVLEYGAKRPKLIYADALKTTTDLTDAQRYEAVKSFTSLICAKYGPFDAVCREHFTKGGSKRSTQLVFGAWAAVDLALASFGYRISADDEFTPATVKKTATGKGKAEKHEVEAGVKRLLGLAEDYVFPNNAGGDASDAVAIALTYLKREGAI